MGPYGVAHREEAGLQKLEYFDTVGVTGSNPVSRTIFKKPKVL